MKKITGIRGAVCCENTKEEITELIRQYLPDLPAQMTAKQLSNDYLHYNSNLKVEVTQLLLFSYYPLLIVIWYNYLVNRSDKYENLL